MYRFNVAIRPLRRRNRLSDERSVCVFGARMAIRWSKVHIFCLIICRSVCFGIDFESRFLIVSKNIITKRIGVDNRFMIACKTSSVLMIVSMFLTTFLFPELLFWLLPRTNELYLRAKGVSMHHSGYLVCGEGERFANVDHKHAIFQSSNLVFGQQSLWFT